MFNDKSFSCTTGNNRYRIMEDNAKILIRYNVCPVHTLQDTVRIFGKVLDLAEKRINLDCNEYIPGHCILIEECYTYIKRNIYK